MERERIKKRREKAENARNYYDKNLWRDRGGPILLVAFFCSFFKSLTLSFNVSIVTFCSERKKRMNGRKKERKKVPVTFSSMSSSS